MEHQQRLGAARFRLAQYYLNIMRASQRIYQQGHENEAYALAMFDQEKDQIKRWQAWTTHNAEEDEQATALCSAYAGASPDIFKLRLLPQEYLRWLETAVEAARRLGDRYAEVDHLLELGEMHNHLSASQQALACARQVLAFAHQVHDRSLMARAFSVCGMAARNQGKFEEAQAYYDQSLALYQAIGDKRGLAKMVTALSVLALSRRDTAAAHKYLEQGLALHRETGDQEGLISCLNNLGFLAIRLGEYSAARDYLEQGLALCQITRNTLGISIVLTNLGNLACAQGEDALARNYFEEGLTAARLARVREREAICLHKLGQVTLARGELLQAQDYFEQSLGCSTPTGILLPESLSKLALTYLLLGQAGRAYATLRKGLEVARGLPDSLAHARLFVLVAAARMWVLRGHPSQATRWLSLVENDPHPAVKMTDIKRDIQVGRAECEAAVPPDQFRTAWEEGKTLSLDAVIAEILGELQDYA